METVNLTVTNVVCGGCSMRIESVLTKLDGIGAILIDIPTKVLTLDYDPAVISLGQIRDEVVALGYDIEM